MLFVDQIGTYEILWVGFYCVNGPVINQEALIAKYHRNVTNDAKSYRRRMRIAESLLCDVENGNVDKATRRDARKRGPEQTIASSEPPKKKAKTAKLTYSSKASSSRDHAQ